MRKKDSHKIMWWDKVSQEYMPFYLIPFDQYPRILPKGYANNTRHLRVGILHPDTARALS
jgi:hypothetical protein